jgi:hypothetical protein
MKGARFAPGGQVDGMTPGWCERTWLQDATVIRRAALRSRSLALRGLFLIRVAICLARRLSKRVLRRPMVDPFGKSSAGF